MKVVLCIIAASLVACAYSVYAVPHRVDGILSTTRSFSLNGRWYSVDKPAGSDTIIRDEVTRKGVDLARIPRESGDPEDFLLDPLTERSPKKDRSLPCSLPSSFRARNSLQLESEAAILDITCGTVSPKGNLSMKELAATGWKIAETGNSPGAVSVATIRKGRETSIVFLEEKEGSCLFLRQLEK